MNQTHRQHISDRASVTQSVGPTEPFAVTLKEATRMTGVSRSELYRRAGKGEIVLVKCGSTTLATFQSLRALVASFPTAAIRTTA